MGNSCPGASKRISTHELAGSLTARNVTAYAQPLLPESMLKDS